MRNEKDSNRLNLYIVLSLIIHLFIFFIFPYGNLSVMGNNGSKREFGFVQFVEYKAEKTNSNNSKKVTEKPAKDTNTKKEQEVVEKTTAPQPKPETTKENVVKNEPKPEIKEEPIVEKPVATNKPAEKVDEQVLTSENSDLTVKVEDKQENNKPSTEKSVDTVEEKDRKNEEKDTTTEEEKPAPPPPPTAGDLIIGAPVPAYPKDLVGQALKGKVILEVNVDSSGKVNTVDILESSEIEQMDRTAKLTLERGWQFKNYKQSYSIVITVDYYVDENGNPKVEIQNDRLTFK